MLMTVSVYPKFAYIYPLVSLFLCNVSSLFNALLSLGSYDSLFLCFSYFCVFTLLEFLFYIYGLSLFDVDYLWFVLHQPAITLKPSA